MAEGVENVEVNDKQKVLEEFIDVVNSSTSATVKSGGKFVNDAKDAEDKLRKLYAKLNGEEVAKNLSDSELIAFTKECTKRIGHSTNLADRMMGLDSILTNHNTEPTSKNTEFASKKTATDLNKTATDLQEVTVSANQKPRDIYDGRLQKGKKSEMGDIPNGEDLADFPVYISRREQIMAEEIKAKSLEVAKKINRLRGVITDDSNPKSAVRNRENHITPEDIAVAKNEGHRK